MNFDANNAKTSLRFGVPSPNRTATRHVRRVIATAPLEFIQPRTCLVEAAATEATTVAAAVVPPGHRLPVPDAAIKHRIKRRVKMFGLSTVELAIVLVIVVILFGVGRLSKIGGELGQGIQSFREGMKGDDTESDGEEETES
jgi:sec-independent protein translocase protein TatA